MPAQYELLIPDMKNTTSSGNVSISKSSAVATWRTPIGNAFARDGSKFDSEPNASMSFYVDFRDPVYVEKITFSGQYLTRATIYINGTITHDRVALNSNNTLTIPKQNRAGVTPITLDITGNASNGGTPYFYISNIQAHSPIPKVLIEMHDNLYTISGDVASIVKPVKEAAFSDYDTNGVSIQNVKGLDKITPGFKLHVLDYKW